MRDKELNPKCTVTDCCNAIFSMVKECLYCDVIVNCYFYVQKSQNQLCFILEEKSVEEFNAILQTKKQRISCAEDVEKGFELINKNILGMCVILIRLKNYIGSDVG